MGPEHLYGIADILRGDYRSYYSWNVPIWLEPTGRKLKVPRG
jgi:hypothetical protein